MNEEDLDIIKQIKTEEAENIYKKFPNLLYSNELNKTIVPFIDDNPKNIGTPRLSNSTDVFIYL
jgi:hypothetical protein